MSEAPPVLEVRNITKRFPGVLANDHINLTLREGRVLGLLGENGAGKSTLMNIIYGLYQPDEGEILINGQPVIINGPNDAIDLGVGMVHQHFQLVETLTVTENVMLGNESTSLLQSFDPRTVLVLGIETIVVTGIVRGLFELFTTGPFEGLFLGMLSGLLLFLVMMVMVILAGFLAGGTLNSLIAGRRIVSISKEYGLEVNPDALIADLPVGIQQRVEIIKALYRNARILILDEPTAVLTPQEARGLFSIMRTLLERGVSIIFISHKLKEILEICDDVSVLHLGKVAGHADPRESTEQSLASLMVGRDVLLQTEKAPAQPGEIVLRVDNLHVEDDRGLPAVEGVTFEVYSGEILGVAGVQGNGQTELVEALTGMRTTLAGNFYVADENLTDATPRQITEAGTAHVPEDRQRDGLVGPFAIMHNMVLNTYHHKPFSRGILVNDPAIEDYARKLVEEYDVRTPGIYTSASSLSGGNQQKVIVAREFSRPLKLLIASQPTRGLDVGSIEFIHSQIVRMRDEGAGILLVSSELDEILGLSDRVAVMFEGKLIDILPIEEADRDKVGLRMAGIKDDIPEGAIESGTTESEGTV